MTFGAQELGAREKIHMRLGIDAEEFMGVDRQRDPGAVASNAFVDAINVRLLPTGEVISRGGQARMNTVAMDECVVSIFDDQND